MIGGIHVQGLAKFPFCLIQFCLGYVQVPQVIANLSGFRIQFEGVPEGVEGFLIILCLRTGETQKRVSVGARGILFELFKDCALRLLNASVAKKLPMVSK